MLKGKTKKIERVVEKALKAEHDQDKLNDIILECEQYCEREVNQLAETFIKKGKKTDMLLKTPIHYKNKDWTHIEFDYHPENGYNEPVLFYIDENGEKVTQFAPAVQTILPIIEKVKELYGE